jgi:hypothetical protein
MSSIKSEFGNIFAKLLTEELEKPSIAQNIPNDDDGDETQADVEELTPDNVDDPVADAEALEQSLKEAPPQEDAHNPEHSMNNAFMGKLSEIVSALEPAIKSFDGLTIPISDLRDFKAMAEDAVKAKTAIADFVTAFKEFKPKQK